MSGLFARRKRVTDPLDDDAKARLVGWKLSYESSGSEHSDADVDVDDSPCLSELVHDFLEVDQDDDERQSFCYDSDSDRVDSVSDCSEDSIIRSVCVDEMDLYRNMMLSQVVNGMEVFALWRNEKAVYRRKVMLFLREVGHNAAICKTKWDSSGGLNAGNYEFIDAVVLLSNNQNSRYIIDIDFASQFEIARPTNQYLKLLQSLPRVFVGKSEDLKKTIRVMSDAARRSLKTRELLLPPWRKNRYMQNKWLGPYRRTSNHQISGNPDVIGSPVSVVKCRLVGFDNDAVNSHLFVRTR